MEGFRMLFWYWWCLALILGALEMFIPGAAFLWIGGAAAIVGFIAMIPGVGLPLQLVLFGALAVLAWFLSRRIARRDPPDIHAGTLNRRADAYVGRVFVLEEAMIDGQGRVRVGDGQWSVSGPGGLPAGAHVRVIGVDGAMLLVEPA